jgi:hypothetical protein
MSPWPHIVAAESRGDEPFVRDDRYKPPHFEMPTMPTRRRQQFITGHLAWMLATVLVLTLLESLSYELFFVISLIGFLVVTELTAPFAVRPRWRRRLKWLIALGLAVFGYIVVRRILEILPSGVF